MTGAHPKPHSTLLLFELQMVKNAAFVFIKPHAVTAQTKVLVKEGESQSVHGKRTICVNYECRKIYRLHHIHIS